jgi:tight adherence protein B
VSLAALRSFVEHLAAWVAVALIAAGAGAATYAALADPDGAVRRAWARYCASLDAKLQRAFVFHPGRSIALAQLGGLAAIAIAATALPKGGLWCAVVAVLVLFGPQLALAWHLQRRLRAIDLQVQGFLVAMANALKSRPAVADALASVTGLTPKPLRQEIELSVKQMRFGSSLEQTLVTMSARVGSKPLDTAISALLIGRQVGGNLPVIMETTAAAMREMERLEGVVRTKTAEGKAQLWVLALFPLALMLSFNAVSPGYFDALTESTVGTLATVIALGCWGASLVVAQRILAVDI